MSAALCLKRSGVSKICAAQCTKPPLKQRNKSEIDIAVGWTNVRRTDYDTFEKQKIIPHALSIILRYLVCWC